MALSLFNGIVSHHGFIKEAVFAHSPPYLSQGCPSRQPTECVVQVHQASQHGSSTLAARFISPCSMVHQPSQHGSSIVAACRIGRSRGRERAFPPQGKVVPASGKGCSRLRERSSSPRLQRLSASVKAACGSPARTMPERHTHSTTSPLATMRTIGWLCKSAASWILA